MLTRSRAVSSYSGRAIDAFHPGTPVALREIWLGRVWKARPAVVVRDDAEVALWTPQGAPMWIAHTGSGIPAASWRLIPFESHWECLRLTRPGSPLVFGMTRRDGVFDGWHVDVVRPLRRFAAGFEYLDLELDVLLEPSGAVAVVDEDEFEESCRRGVIDALEAVAVRREAASALEAVRAESWPLTGGCESWQPDPEWQLPTLPTGWDEPAADLPRLR